MSAILTAGHSNHPAHVFLQLLARHDVTALVDVRSTPYSRFNPQFNREQIAETLENSGIEYIHLGHELGGRSDDPANYQDGKVRYDRLSRTPSFRNGLRRLLRYTENFKVALMCAEKEPLNCHRTLLIGHELDRKSGVNISHILPDGRLELHADTMTRLLEKFGHLREEDLFRSRDERISEAIALQARRVGHSIERNPT